jgi:hypothetical protein
MNQRHMASVPEWVWEYCRKEEAHENVRASAVLVGLIRSGIEHREAEKAEADRAKRVVQTLRAIA